MRKLKITPGEWVIPSNLKKRDSVATSEGANSESEPMFWTVASANSLRDEWEANAEFIAEAGTVANETGVMPRELLAQRDELSAIVNQILDETAGQYLSDAMRDRALAAIARVRGDS